MKTDKITRFICILLSLAIVNVCAGCAGNEEAGNRSGSNPKNVEDVLQAGISDTDAGKEESDSKDGETKTDTSADGLRQSGLNDNAPDPETFAGEDVTLSSTEGIDVDLTAMSGTMVYSEVYNMMYEPDQYIGKMIKMNGTFSEYHDESSGNYYFACIIKDAAACCSQGMEFVLMDDYAYPDDYPEDGETITVTGVFDTYMEGKYKYCTLREAVLE